MRNAGTILGIIRKRGAEGKALDQIYRMLFNPELYIAAYAKISSNKGAMTKGITDETVDGMSLSKINDIISLLRDEKYQFSPARRVYIEKKNGKMRPLGLPTWSDKLLQEVMRMILEAYYEPQFSQFSHGFRPNRGCHTALTAIVKTWTASTWFIEGDIKGCFDNIDHKVLLMILRGKIKDNRFIRLIERLLHAGYMDEWKYHKTWSGTPQGGVLSPLLSNIYLNELDRYVEQVLLPKYNKGKARARNREYEVLHGIEHYNRRMGRIDISIAARKKKQTLPSFDPYDPNYRRLRYVRYADDFLLGFSGPRSEAEEIKKEVSQFLSKELNLEVSQEKTLITHGRTGKARFLGYDIQVGQCDTFRSGKDRRSVNGNIRLLVPSDIVRKHSERYFLKGRVRRRPELLEESDYTIIHNFQTRFRGLANYYQLACDRSKKLSSLKGIMSHSLMMTLANKHKTWVSKIYQRYGVRCLMANGKYYKCIQARIDRINKPPLTATWGGISLARNKNYRSVVLPDEKELLFYGRVERLKAMLASECEMCGATSNIQVHHIRALKDLAKRGRKPTVSQKRMAARRRKTLVVCHSCHVAIHQGKL
jgi:group II intron reverse transcriptase/maturase|uniref:reverse transcriptase/maturase family protein n=1 Tax=Serratia proteamaculans TaxID=28151 RepID=UPI001F4BD943|nr:reverse transcriptase/maturase family protein [Serratia proteamaculans]ULG15714.1 reverse transcriptase [Serratia proteamaculans]